MTIAVTSSTSSLGSTANATIPKPATVNNNDILVAILGGKATVAGTYAIPAGWTVTQLYTATGNDCYTGIFYRTVPNAAALTGTFTFTGTAAQTWAAYIQALSGVNQTSPQDVSFTGKWQNMQNATIGTTPSYTTVTDRAFGYSAFVVNFTAATTQSRGLFGTSNADDLNSILNVYSGIFGNSGSTTGTTALTGIAATNESQSGVFLFRENVPKTIATPSISSLKISILSPTPSVYSGVTFPKNGLLDQFNRANEGPPMTGWADILGGMKVSSNQSIGNAVGASISKKSSPSIGNDFEVYYTIISKSATADQLLGGCIDSSSNGYGFQLTVLAGTDQIDFLRIDAGTGTSISSVTQEITNNDGIGFSRVGSVLTVWYRSGLSGSWTSLGTFSDSTYTLSNANVYAGVSYAATSPTIDDFGGGTLVAASGTTTATPAIETISVIANTVTVKVSKSAIALPVIETASVLINTAVPSFRAHSTVTPTKLVSSILTNIPTTKITYSRIATPSVAISSIQVKTAVASTSAAQSSTATPSKLIVSTLINTVTTKISNSATSLPSKLVSSVLVNVPITKITYSRTATPTIISAKVHVNTAVASTAIKTVASPSIAISSVITNAPTTKYTRSTTATPSIKTTTVIINQATASTGATRSSIATPSIVTARVSTNQPTTLFNASRTASPSAVISRILVNNATASTNSGAKIATPTKAVISIVSSTPITKVVINNTALAIKASASVTVNSPVASVARNAVATPTAKIITILANVPSVRITQSRVSTPSGSIITIKVYDATASSITAGSLLTITIVLQSRVSTTNRYTSRIDPYINNKSRIETSESYKSRIDKYIVNNSEMQTTILEESHL